MDTFLRFSHKVDTLGAVFENSKPRDQIDLQIPGYPVTLSVKGYEPQTEWESSACLALHFELIQEFHDRSLAKSV